MMEWAADKGADGGRRSGQRHNNQQSTEERQRQAAAGDEIEKTVDGDGQQKGVATVDKSVDTCNDENWWGTTRFVSGGVQHSLLGDDVG